MTGLIKCNSAKQFSTITPDQDRKPDRLESSEYGVSSKHDFMNEKAQEKKAI